MARTERMLIAACIGCGAMHELERRESARRLVENPVHTAGDRDHAHV
jgi:hypothetical protein